MREVVAGGVRLGVRPLRADEAPFVVDYFLGLSDADMERMGIVERSRLPERDAWVRSVAATTAGGPTHYTAWLVDGRPIGHSSLKNLRPGDSAEMHLHMWVPEARGKGHGAVLFSLAALDAFERFRLQGIVCEPQAANPMPNRMLQKAGYPLQGTRVGSSSELSRVTTLNRYDVRRDVAEAVVRRARRRPLRKGHEGGAGWRGHGAREDRRQEGGGRRQDGDAARAGQGGQAHRRPQEGRGQARQEEVIDSPDFPD